VGLLNTALNLTRASAPSRQRSGGEAPPPLDSGPSPDLAEPRATAPEAR